MAYIREKIKKGNPYYYIVEGRREGQHVRQIILEYIGTIEKLKDLALTGYLAKENKAISDTSSAEDATNSDMQSHHYANVSFKSYDHGAVMGMLWVAEQIGIEKILSESFKPKTIKGHPRSRVLLLAMIHRAIEPGSKREFINWCRNTSLPYHLQFDVDDFGSATFWEAMDGISEQEITCAWNRIIKTLLDVYQIDLQRFHLDYSNYYTFINTTNGRCVICKRGHNKQKRDDLLQFGLAALTTSILNVPIAWQVYNGNVNDKAEFPIFSAYIRTQLHALGIDPSEVTISFDGGSNSAENFADLGFHFVCAHSMVGHKYLYDIDLSEYQSVLLNNESERLAYFLESIEFSGIHGSGVLVYSSALKDGQVAQMNRDINSIKDEIQGTRDRLNNKRSSLYIELRKRETDFKHKLHDIQEYNEKIDKEEKERTETGTKKRGRAKKHKPLPEWNPEKELLEIVNKAIYRKHKYLKGLSTLSMIKSENDVKDAYIQKYYGKKMICTDHTDWTMEDILNDYTDQECIENGIFRTSKDVDHFAVRPQYHWTDNKIRVHVFICLAAITIAEVLRIHFANNEIKLPKASLLDRLNEIHDGWVFVDENKVHRVIEKLDCDHQQLWEVLLDIKKGIKVINDSKADLGTT